MSDNNRSPGSGFHYGWLIVFAGTLTIFAVLGLGRFALGMLLPSMGEGLELSYSEMGFISTGNFLGYLAAVLSSGYTVRRFGARRVIFTGTLTVALSMLLVSRAEGFSQALLFYFLTGVGSGAANVPIMGLVAHCFFLCYRPDRGAGPGGGAGGVERQFLGKLYAGRCPGGYRHSACCADAPAVARKRGTVMRDH